MTSPTKTLPARHTAMRELKALLRFEVIPAVMVLGIIAAIVIQGLVYPTERTTVHFNGKTYSCVVKSRDGDRIKYSCDIPTKP